MFVVDTNILIYGADRQANAHKVCRERLMQWRSQAHPWYLTWGIIYEFLRVSTHPRVFQHPFAMTEAWRFIQALLASPSLGILQETERHPQVAREVIDSLPSLEGNLIFDAHIAILMKEHGIRRIYTHDADFHRFDFIDVIDPIQ